MSFCSHSTTLLCRQDVCRQGTSICRRKPNAAEEIPKASVAHAEEDATWVSIIALMAGVVMCAIAPIVFLMDGLLRSLGKRQDRPAVPLEMHVS